MLSENPQRLNIEDQDLINEVLDIAIILRPQLKENKHAIFYIRSTLAVTNDEVARLLGITPTGYSIEEEVFAVEDSEITPDLKSRFDQVLAVAITLDKLQPDIYGRDTYLRTPLGDSRLSHMMQGNIIGILRPLANKYIKTFDTLE